MESDEPDEMPTESVFSCRSVHYSLSAWRRAGEGDVFLQVRLSLPFPSLSRVLSLGATTASRVPSVRSSLEPDTSMMTPVESSLPRYSNPPPSDYRNPLLSQEQGSIALSTFPGDQQKATFCQWLIESEDEWATFDLSFDSLDMV